MLAVSVLIVNYNSGSRLANVLARLAAQSYEDFEVIVLDNASEDDSARATQCAEIPVQLVINEENTGFAGGIMDALAHAKGEWLAILNPDAYPDENWLQALVEASEKYGPDTFLGSVQRQAERPTHLDGLGDVYHASGVAWRGGFGKPASRFPITEDCEIFAPCFAAAMVHRGRFEALGGLDRDFFCYHEDVDIGFRNRLEGGRSILVYDALVDHEGSAITGRYSSFTVFHGIRNRFWTFVQNIPGPLLPICLPLYLFFSLGFLVRSAMLGIARPYVRGIIAGIQGLPLALEKRRKRQRQRRASVREIAQAMSWSPIAPFKRAPDLRPVRQWPPS
ncbi:MAG: glycosyltransferase family 2 protein [Parvularcula sp.]